MQLSKRLQAVADLVTPGNRVADVGCDHAYIPIHLAEHDLSPRIIAMDINQGPIDKAKENIIRHGLEDRIDTRKSNGIEKLNRNEADTIIIAGMGGGLTIQILSEHMEVTKSVRELILQPQSEINKVRQMLSENAYVIIKENMVKDDGKYYMMMKAVHQENIKDSEEFKLLLPEHFYYGRILLQKKNPVLKEFLLWDLGICNEILKTLEAKQTDNAQIRQKEIRNKIVLINSALGYYE